MYRKNVCCFIFNEHIQFLGCVRVHSEHYQCVQGGIEKLDTSLQIAAEREIKEEVGLDASDVHYVQEIPPPGNDPKNFCYELRADANLRRFGFRGQAQRIVLFYAPAESIKKVVVVPPKELNVPQEFSRVDWLSITDLAAKCPPEKAHIFRAVAELAPPIAESYLKAHGMTANPTTSAGGSEPSRV